MFESSAKYKDQQEVALHPKFLGCGPQCKPNLKLLGLVPIK